MKNWGYRKREGGRVFKFKRHFYEVGGGPDKEGVAFVFGDESRARLIAAAPELLEALKIEIEKVRSYGHVSARISEEVLAKLEAQP